MANFLDLKRGVTTDWRAQSRWRSEAANDFDFIAGHQWTDTERAQLEEQSRAPIVFNRVAVIIASVSGSEVNNRTEVRYLPRTIGDAKPNDVLSSGAEWFRDQSMAEDEDSEAFEDTLICGIGVTETSLDFEEDDEGAPKTMRIDPLEMSWDCHAHRKGLQDAQRVHRVRKMPISDARDMFPGVKDEDLDAAWVNSKEEEGEEPHETVHGDQYAFGEGDSSQRPDDTVTIVQTQWCARKKSVEYVIDGQRREMSAAAWAKIEKRMMVDSIPHRKISRKVWRQAFLGATSILKESEPCPDQCTFTFITGRYDRKEKRFYGILRDMKDPQKFANKWLTQILHIINTNAKGGVLAEEGVTDDHRNFEDTYAASDAVTWLKSGMIDKIRDKSGPQFPSVLMALTEFANTAIREASGVNMEMLGLREANQPGVLEYQRRQSAMTTMAGFFDALRFYRKRQGAVILHFLREHIAPTGRLVRLVEDGDARYVPLAVSDDTEKYDVIVDDAPQAPNQKERYWEIIQQLLPVFADKMDANDWAMVAEYSPLPTQFVERLKEKAQQAKDQPDPMQQLAMQREQAEIAKIASETQENEADAQKIIAEIMQMGQQVDEGALKAQESQLGLAMDAAKHQQSMQQDAERHQFGMIAKAQEGRQKLELQRKALEMRQSASSPDRA